MAKPTTISEAIRYYRKKADISQEELAARVGLSDRAVSTWERGTRVPSLEVRERIASALDVNLLDLIFEEDFPMEVATLLGYVERALLEESPQDKARASRVQSYVRLLQAEVENRGTVDNPDRSESVQKH